MIILTGDIHREFYRIYDFCMEYGTTTADILIILGDAGINYYEDESDCELKNWLSTFPITFFCIHGNHEQRPQEIETYEEIEWHEGIVYVEPEFPTILFAKDGEIYDFEGKKAIVIGGAYSVDKYYRLSSNSPWFENEQPSDEIKDYVEEQLNRVGWKIDIVLSHTAPINYEPREVFLPNLNQSLIDKSTEQWLDTIEKKLNYGRWYLGHYHTDKRIDRIRIVFEDYLDFDEGR